jgi:hypothetical protein
LYPSQNVESCKVLIFRLFKFSFSDSLLNLFLKNGFEMATLR